MILVCDRTVSERAVMTREAIFAFGYPCAVASIEDTPNFRPFKILISFADACEEIIGLNENSVHTIIIGEDFVNSAVNIKRVDGVRAALREIRSSVESIYGITEAKKSTFGFSLAPSLFLANGFFTVNGNVIEPTKSEYMIFKYLTAFADTDEYFSPEMIARYSFPLERAEKSVPSVVVHIANLNKKIAAVYNGRVLRSKRCRGYYATKI